MYACNCQVLKSLLTQQALFTVRLVLVLFYQQLFFHLSCSYRCIKLQIIALFSELLHVCLCSIGFSVSSQAVMEVFSTQMSFEVQKAKPIIYSHNCLIQTRQIWFMNKHMMQASNWLFVYLDRRFTYVHCMDQLWAHMCV